MNYYRGYGVIIPCASNETIKADAVYKLLSAAPKYEKACLAVIQDYIEDYCEPGQEPSGKELVECLTEDSPMCCCTVAPIIADVIYEAEDIELYVTGLSDSDVLVLEPRYPWSNNEKLKSMTEEDFRRMLGGYISMVTDTAFDIKEQEWCE